MWIDTQIAQNSSIKTFYSDIILKYYDYDGYVLMMDAGVKTTLANDKVIACIQLDPADPLVLSCAQTVGTSA